MQLPGWTNAWTMPIKTRVDMLTTGIRTPIGIKIFGTDLNEIEKAGVALEKLISPIKGTRSVLYERNLGGLYLDIVPNRDALARYGLRVGDVQRTIEAAIGGTPISMTIEGRNRFSINVRYPQDLRSDMDRLRQVLVPVGDGVGMGAAGDPMEGESGSLEPQFQNRGESRWLLAQAMPGMDGRTLAARAVAGLPGLRVLFVSGYAHDVIAARGILAEGVELLAKPYSAEQLASRLRELLQER